MKNQSKTFKNQSKTTLSHSFLIDIRLNPSRKEWMNCRILVCQLLERISGMARFSRMPHTNSPEPETLCPSKDHGDPMHSPVPRFVESLSAPKTFEARVFLLGCYKSNWNTHVSHTS